MSCALRSDPSFSAYPWELQSIINDYLVNIPTDTTRDLLLADLTPFYAQAAQKYAEFSRTRQSEVLLKFKRSYGTGRKAINRIAAEMQDAANSREFIALIHPFFVLLDRSRVPPHVPRSSAHRVPRLEALTGDKQ